MKRLFTILSAISLLLFLPTAAYLFLLLLASIFVPEFHNVWCIQDTWLFALCLLLLTPIMPVLWLNSHVSHAEKRQVFNFFSATSLLMFLPTACYLLLFVLVSGMLQLSRLISGTQVSGPWEVRGMWLFALCFLLLTLILPVLWLNSHVKKQRRLKQGLCLTCGYDLRASKERCPECGTPISVQTASSTKL